MLRQLLEKNSLTKNKLINLKKIITKNAQTITFENLEEKSSWHTKCSISVSFRGSKTLAVFLTSNSTDFLIRDLETQNGKKGF